MFIRLTNHNGCRPTPHVSITLKAPLSDDVYILLKHAALTNIINL